LVSFLMWATLG